MSLQPVTVQLDVSEPQELQLGVQSGQTVELDNGVVIVQGSDKHYTHDQTVAAAVWEITHNLGKYPSVSVVDSGGNWVVGDVAYLDENSLTVTFSGAFSGKAYMN